MELTTDTNSKIDRLEAALAEYEPVEMPLKHTFTDGLYIREIFIPAGTILTSLIHLQTHPYFVMEGKISVFSENDGEQLLEAPCQGVTTPNTRRVLFAHTDVRWITTHPCINGEAVDEIEDRIIAKRQNPLLTDEELSKFSQLHRYGIENINSQLTDNQ